MTTSKITVKDIYYFKESDYPQHEFYCCADKHTLIAFTTQYCPLCHINEKYLDVLEEAETTDAEYEALEEQHYNLLAKLKKLYPEVLV